MMVFYSTIAIGGVKALCVGQGKMITPAPKGKSYHHYINSYAGVLRAEPQDRA